LCRCIQCYEHTKDYGNECEAMNAGRLCKATIVSGGLRCGKSGPPEFWRRAALNLQKRLVLVIAINKLVHVFMQFLVLLFVHIHHVACFIVSKTDVLAY
jgi:hypothetical protein